MSNDTQIMCKHACIRFLKDKKRHTSWGKQRALSRITRTCDFSGITETEDFLWHMRKEDFSENRKRRSVLPGRICLPGQPLDRSWILGQPRVRSGFGFSGKKSGSQTFHFARWRWNSLSFLWICPKTVLKCKNQDFNSLRKYVRIQVFLDPGRL